MTARMASSLHQGRLSEFSFAFLVLGLLLLAGPPALASVESCEGDGTAGGVCASPTIVDTGRSLVLYGNPGSTCTRRVLLALYEKGLTVS